MLKSLYWIILLIILSSVVYGATIHGSIYDLNLQKVDNVVVEVDSEPQQRMISKDGMYSFTLNPGSYQITAEYKDNSSTFLSKEKIDVHEDGDFVLDLFLYPDLGEEQQLLNESEVISVGDPFIPSGDAVIRMAYIAVFVIFGLSLLGTAGFAFYFYRKKKEIGDVKQEISSGELDDELNQLMEFIKKEGGRTTQKDIRKAFPQSEAKISLMITDLEHKGYVEKIKKGRGNVIILKK